MTAATLSAVFVALFAAHHLGDHVIQTDHQAATKALPGRRGWAAMAGHLATYHAAAVVALILLALAGVPLTVAGCAAGLALSAVTHGFLDRRWPVQWILRATGSPRFAESTTPLHGGYLADQSLHIACLFVSALLVAVIR
jgi:hypothetical protein